MKRVILAAPCVKRYDLLQKLFESAERGTRKPDRYFAVDNGGGLCTKQASKEICLPKNTTVVHMGRHIGVAGTWNLALGEHPDAWVVISNDDVELHAATIESLVQAAEDHFEAGFIYPAFNPGAMFCVFIVKHRVVAQIGGFDEQFYPAYFEDTDFHHRMKKAGIVEFAAPNASYDHVGSATMKSFNEREMKTHHEQFKANRNRYIAKWGSVPGLEAYDVPKT